jgi:hypothetical protein
MSGFQRFCQPVRLLTTHLTFRLLCGSMTLVVLDGELAVPCTRNPP